MLTGKINIIAMGLAGLIFMSPPSFGAEQLEACPFSQERKQDIGGHCYIRF